MYFVVTYDINEKRVNKVRKILQKYFTWVQNSVFEGATTEAKLEKCKQELKQVICEEDSIYFYKVENRKNLEKMVIGIEKDMTTNIL